MTLQDTILAMPQTECEILHHYAPGLYVREMRQPAGVLVVGKIHKTSHMNIIPSGRCTVATESGPMEITGPFMYRSEVGAKRVIYAHEDTVWLNLIPTDLTDPDEIEAAIIAEDWSEVPHPDEADYRAFLRTSGITEEIAQAATNTGPFLDIDMVLHDLFIADSYRHGKGVFTKTDRKEGEYLGPGLLDGEKTQIGRYMNHSSWPSAVAVMEGDNIMLSATRDIPENEEITVDYRAMIALTGFNRKGG